MDFTTLTRSFAVSLCTALCLAATADAQDVLLNEVRADGVETWIELYNRSAVAVDLSTWSLHHASHTPGMPQNYWWPFPAGTVLPSGGFLRVHWYRIGVNAPAAGELYTGVSPYAFLFGLGGEALSGAEGAFALFRSQANEQMTSAAAVEDWVSWGGYGYQREPLAIQAGLWSPARAVPSIPAGRSIARDPAAVGAVAFADEAWFVDATPTPLGPNVTGAITQAYGTACTLPGNHLLGAPTLQTTSLPLLGNGAFGFAVEHTTGIFGEYVLIGFSTGAAQPGQPSILPPFAGVGCSIAVDATGIFASWLVPAQIVATTLPLPLAGQPPAIVGAELHVQALVIDLLPFAFPPYQGVSNALRIVVGQ